MPANAPDPWAILLVDKLITGLVLLVGGWLLNRKLESFRSSQAHALESFRSQKARETESRRSLDEREREWSRETRIAITDLATTIASCNQSIAWLTWRAQHCPLTITQERVNDYDMEVKGILTEMFRCRVRVAALDETAHIKIAPCITEVYRLDTAVATAAALLEEDRSRSMESLANIYPQAENLYDSLLKTVSNELKQLSTLKTDSRHD